MILGFVKFKMKLDFFGFCGKTCFYLDTKKPLFKAVFN